MSALTRLLPPERRTLVADALVLTTAVAAAVLGLITLVEEEVGDSGWYSWVSSLALLGVVLVCPYVVWRLHGRHDTRSSTAGASLGLLLGGGVLWVLLIAVGLISVAVSWAVGVSDGVVALVLVGGLLTALVVALDVDALRDLAGRHLHVGTDVARLAATVVALATVAVALWYASANADQAPAELLAFGLAAGIVGAVGALGADVASTMRASGTQPAT